MKSYFNKYTMALLISLVIAVTIFLYRHNTPHAIKPTLDPALVQVKESLHELHSNNANKRLSEEEKLNIAYKILDQLPPEYTSLKRQYQIALSTLPNITFYGRIIDQYGQPVKNARVWYEGTGTYLSAGGGRGNAFTDEQGYFEIDTEGASLTLGTVTHPDISDVSYDPPKYSNSTLPVNTGSVNFVGGEDSRGIYSDWHKYTEKDNAYLVHAWRLGTYEGAIEGGGSFGVYSGKMYTINLTQPDKTKRIKEGLHDGDLHISCTRPHIDSYHGAHDWSLTIEPISGGIVETDDLYMNLAPETGYKSRVELNMRKDSPDYKNSLLNKRYFITLNNGHKYGSLFINVVPFASIDEDACSVRIYSKINPNGSRNLELKKEKTSQPPQPPSEIVGVRSCIETLYGNARPDPIYVQLDI